MLSLFYFREMPNFYILLFCRFYYLIKKHTGDLAKFTPLQLASFAFSLGETFIIIAFLIFSNISQYFSQKQFSITGFSILGVLLSLHLIYFNKNKKYLRLFFYRKKGGPHKLDLVILLLIILSVKSLAYIFESQQVKQELFIIF